MKKIANNMWTDLASPTGKPLLWTSEAICQQLRFGSSVRRGNVQQQWCTAKALLSVLVVLRHPLSCKRLHSEEASAMVRAISMHNVNLPLTGAQSLSERTGWAHQGDGDLEAAPNSRACLSECPSGSVQKGNGLHHRPGCEGVQGVDLGLLVEDQQHTVLDLTSYNLLACPALTWTGLLAQRCIALKKEVSRGLDANSMPKLCWLLA